MKHWIVAAALAVFCSSPALAETRAVGAFQEVNAADRIVVTVVSGAEHAVEVTGEDADRVRTRVENGALKISDLRRPWFGAGPQLEVSIRVSAPSIDGLAASRGATITASLDQTDCADFSARAAMGASLAAAGLRCETADVSAAMGADVRVFASQSYDASAAMGGAIHVSGGAPMRNASAAMGGAVTHNR